MNCLLTGPESLRLSIENPEPPIDEAYGRDELVISDDPDRPNALMRANQSMLELITAYGVAMEKGDDAFCEKCLESMLPLLTTRGINNTEFTSFWETRDVSYSVYKKLPPSEKMRFLRAAAAKYFLNRHRLYSRHGYTATTLQVKSDSFAHKRSGALARAKIETILQAYGIEYSEAFAKTGVLGNCSFAYPERKQDKRAFLALLERCAICFSWRASHNGKFPDLVMRLNGRLLIVEHKHMKEWGGGQDKQIVEIIEFVRQEEASSDVHYVSFLDGILFNALLCDEDVRAPKVLEQRRRIKESVATYPKNHFVNTHGFVSLVASLTSSDNR